jgi:L-glutamine:2-deoxy-scyllo-inosose/3-amino-2,3-dideoxy-scyllo-inosose aminotransferase
LAITGGKPIRSKAKEWPRWPISDAADVKRLADITRSNAWSYDGPHEWDFARNYTKYLRAAHGLCCANGTVAIQLALEALGIGAYDEVIVPGFTWQATAAACLDVNAVPVLVDVEPDTWCLDVKKAERAITQKTRAIIVVHLYGCMPDMTGLQKICKKHGLALIEDCAHQHGSFWKGRGVGSLGDVGCFSFQESKVLSCGEGGFNTAATETLFERLYSLRNCGRGWKDKMDNTLQSGNFRLTEWQAGMLQGALKRLDKQVKHRDANAKYLNAKLAKIPGILPMRRRSEVTQQSYFNFVFRIDPFTLDGVTNGQFSKALTAELNPTGYQWDRPYEPLNRCMLYKPQTKRRHHLNAKYWRAIDPRRASLPVSTDAHERSGVVIHHHALMGGRGDMDDIARAVAKLVENSGELRQIESGRATVRNPAVQR